MELVFYVPEKDVKVKVVKLYFWNLRSISFLAMYQKTVHEDIQSRLFQVHKFFESCELRKKRES